VFITVIYVILLVEWVMRRRSGSPARKQYHPLSFLARLNRRGGRLDRRNTAPNQIMTEKQLKPRISTCPADVETALPSGVLIADMPFNSHISSSGEVEVAPRLGNFDSVPAAAPGDSKVGLTLSWIGITTLLIVIRYVSLSTWTLPG